MGVRHKYRVDVYDQSTGDLHGSWINGISLEYKRTMNNVGMCVWAVHEDHPVLDVISEDDRVEVGITTFDSTDQSDQWVDEFVGVYRENQIATDQLGNRYHALYIPEATEVLSRSIVAYPAGTSNRSDFSAVGTDTIFQNIWQYNATSSGTTGDGRERNAEAVIGSVTGISFDATTINYGCAWKNTLTALKELADKGSGYFWVTRNSNTNALVVQGGTADDKSSDIIFTESLTNLGKVSLKENKLTEKTVAIVGGGGQESNRTVRIRTGANQSSTNDYEIFADARDTTNTTTLDDRGDIVMSQREAKETLTARILPTSGYVYGENNDYELSDLVSVKFGDSIVTKQITAVTVRFNPFREIEFELSDQL